MKVMLATLFSLLVIECISRGKYVVYSEWNQTCVTDGCSICCVDKICIQGYYPYQCKHGCIDGHRGIRCYELCTYNCKSCKNNIDICDSCYDGFYPGDRKDCASTCPPNCKTCSSNLLCDSCKKGFYDKDGSSTCEHFICPINCECDETDCVACKNGFYDIENSCNKTCPLNCLACSSFKQCSQCQNGFYNGYGLHSDRLLNDCTYKCRDACITCSSYDNCVKCPAGKYGLQCQENCSGGCKDNTCLIEAGKCNCTSNFSGEKCTECVTGKYGNMCEQFCPNNCENSICHMSSGNCIVGCKHDTMSGAKCERCVVGRYGTLCENICSENCKTGICDKNTGNCSDGCENHFNGKQCDQCINGRYGDKCQYVCPNTCADNMCEMLSGNCYKCTGNFDGNKCDTCKPGLYGLKCDQNCSYNCLHNTCNKITGICTNGCKSYYSGDKCCVQNNNCMQCISNTECRKCKSGYLNSFCSKKCPINCLDSCDISTGVCRDCIINHFGNNCNLTCSENCKAAYSSEIRQCSSFDGTCVFGCEDGYFGFLCNETCSQLCIDGVCMRESGICVEGCTGSYNDPVCSLRSGKPQDASADTSTVAVIAVLATLLVVTSTALCILMLKKLVKKLRSPDRQREQSMVQINFDNSMVEEQDIHNEYQENTITYPTSLPVHPILDRRHRIIWMPGIGHTAVSEDNVAYESLDKTQAPEHTYDTASESTVNVRNVDYENV